MSSSPSPPSDPQILSPQSAGYEQSRAQYYNGRVPAFRPALIHCPRTTSEVVNAINQARSLHLQVGVRSGGHLFPCCSLIDNGMLIDTRNLNRNVEYDLSNKVVSFSPGVTAQELEQYLSGIGRFFPIGHSPTVGLGGFLLAGGQGWFMRGWGLSSTHSWIRQLEIVTATGETVIANRTQNEDLFWAAPGSGQGFFGVVTRIWGNTIPAKRLFDKLVVFDVTEIVNFKKILKWVLETSDKTPKYGIDMTFSVMFADRSAPGLKDDSVQKKLVLTAALVAYADHLDEANVLLSPWASTPDIFQPHLLENTSVNETTWGHLWDQEEFMPAGHGERWKCDSILTDPKIDYNELVESITPCLWDLPSLHSIGTICPVDFVPFSADHALSLPQKFYVSNMACWRDPERDAYMDRWMQQAFSEAEKVSVGQYIADFDVTHRMTKVMTDRALKRWLQIRKKWDPKELFVGHRGFSSILQKETARI